MSRIDSIKLNDDIIIKGLYTLIYQEKKAEFIFPGEAHDFWEFIYVDKGYLYVLLEDKGYKVNQGELLFFGKNQNHIIWSDVNITPCFVNIAFDMDFYDNSFFEHRKFKTNTDSKNLLEKLLLERNNAFGGDLFVGYAPKKIGSKFGSKQLIKIYLVELLLKLYRQNEMPLSDVVHLSSILDDKTENLLLNKSTSYIKEHLCDKIYVEDISKKLFISSSYLNRIYKNAYNLTVMEYVNHLRLEKSKELLREENLNISQISDLLGFSTLHYFSHLFKQKYGMSPREYSRTLDTYS